MYHSTPMKYSAPPATPIMNNTMSPMTFLNYSSENININSSNSNFNLSFKECVKTKLLNFAEKNNIATELVSKSKLSNSLYLTLLNEDMKCSHCHFNTKEAAYIDTNNGNFYHPQCVYNN